MRPTLFFLTLFWAILPVVSAESVKPLRGLLVTGGCCHDYTNQKRILAEGLAARLPVQWTVVHDVVLVDGKDTAATREHVTSAYAKENWAEGYDVVLHNECFGAIKDEAFIERMTRPHKAGLPAVFLHCAMHSYRAAANADLWRELIGLKSTFHEPGAVLTVKALPSKHPVMAGFPEVFVTPEKDELYVAEKVYDTATPLATVFSEKRQAENPVVWVNETGRLRSFSTSLGHLNSTMERPEYLDLVARGLLWACGKLDADGKPAPGYGAPGK